MAVEPIEKDAFMLSMQDKAIFPDTAPNCIIAFSYVSDAIDTVAGDAPVMGKKYLFANTSLL